MIKLVSKEYADQSRDIKTLEQITISAVRIESADGKQRIRLQGKDNTTGSITKYIEFYLNEIHTKIFDLKQYLNLNTTDIRTILEVVRTVFNNMPIIKEYDHLGLQFLENNVTGYAGSVCFDAKGQELIKDEFADMPKKCGNHQPVLEILETCFKGKVKLQIIYLIGLSSVICGLLNKNLFCNVVGLSSTGKTTASELAISAFTNIDGKLRKSWATTENALVKGLDGHKGIPVMVDDTQNTKIKVFQSVIYQIINGESKDRLIKGNVLAPKNFWATSVLSTSEKSMIDNCVDEGVLPRLFEIPVYPNELFDNAEQANKVQTIYHSNFGCVAPIFIKYLFENDYVRSESISQAYSEEVKKIRQTLEDDKDNIISRCVESTAIVTLTGRLASEALGIQFDINNVQDTMLGVYRQNIEDFREDSKKKNIFDIAYPALKEYAKNNCFKKEEKGVVVAYITSEQMKTVLQPIKNQYRVTDKAIKTELENNGKLLRTNGELNYNRGEIKGRAFELVI
jgi:hypothetical protein